jgi:Ankyrin repeat
MKALIDNGADVDARNSRNRTPLHRLHACKLMSWLINCGSADPDLRDNIGERVGDVFAMDSGMRICEATFKRRKTGGEYTCIHYSRRPEDRL